MANLEVCGLVERRPRLFDEYPYYSTFSLRIDDDALVEVFLPTATVEGDPARYRPGRRLVLTGGRQQVDPGVNGRPDYIRYWPDRVRVVEEPALLF